MEISTNIWRELNRGKFAFAVTAAKEQRPTGKCTSWPSASLTLREERCENPSPIRVSLLSFFLFHSLFWPGFKSPAAKSEWKCNLECSAAWNSMHWPWARSSDKCQFAFDLQMFFFWLPLIAPPPLQSPILSAQLPNTPAPTVSNHWNRNR